MASKSRLVYYRRTVSLFYLNVPTPTPTPSLVSTHATAAAAAANTLLFLLLPLLLNMQDFDPQRFESLKWMLANTGMRDMGFDFEDVGEPDRVSTTTL